MESHVLCDDDGDKEEGETFLSSAMIILLCCISRVLYVEVAVFSQSFRSFVLDPFQPPPSLARLPPDLFNAPGGVRPGLQYAVAHTSNEVC